MSNEIGVNESVVESQPDAGDLSPQSSIESGNGEQSQPNEEGQVTEAKAEVKKGPDYNWKAMREAVRQRDEQIKSLKGAADLDRWLKSNPKNLRTIMDLMEGRETQSQPQSQNNVSDKTPQFNFEQYDADTQGILKFLYDKALKADELIQWKVEQERREQERQTSTVKEREAQMETNMLTLNTEFDELLVKDGYLAKDYSGGESPMVNLIRYAVMAALTETMGDARRATRDQLNKAYGSVISGLSAHRKHTLKEAITSPGTPATGSKQGTAMTAKPARSEAQRISELTEAISALNQG